MTIAEYTDKYCELNNGEYLEDVPITLGGKSQTSETTKPEFEPPLSMLSSFRVVVVGDIYEEWELEHDSKAIHFLTPDLVLFTGEFGNENVELVKGIAELNFPKGAILGNHDSWLTSKLSSKVKDRVRAQLECLSEVHVGYGHLDFPSLKLNVVGGRPFSYGGDNLFRKKPIKARYGVRDMEESAEQIYKASLQTPNESSIILLSHYGPK
ncbi:UDP-2 3-diacylglucosamine pyrophosphatase LpxG, partial [Bienertia sinuspersici]